MLRLNISQQYAKINLTIDKPRINLNTTQPHIELSAEAAKVEISQPYGRLEIDQTPCRASIGLKTWAEFTQDFADAGRNGFLEAVADAAQEGDRMAAIEKEPEAIANIAWEKINPEPAEVSLEWIENPIINYQMNPPEYNVTPGKLNSQFYPATLDNNFHWGKVNTGISHYQSIKFWTTENKWDMYI